MIDARGFTYGFLLGLGSMFLLDPDRGGTRRARLRDAVLHVAHELEDFWETGTRDLENRTRGIGARARSVLEKPETPSDDVLVARVRSRLGRVTSHAHAIAVRAKDGNEIELKGPALASEHDRIVRAIARVPGVDAVDDDLVVYADADGIPGLQGHRPHRSGAGPLRAPGPKLLAGASAAALLVSPLAPDLVRTVLAATLRRLLRDATQSPGAAAR
jgi:hypothetical protein